MGDTLIEAMPAREIPKFANRLIDLGGRSSASRRHLSRIVAGSIPSTFKNESLNPRSS